MTLGEIIKTYRSQNDLTMDDFAKLSGISKGYISMLEKNRNPSTEKPIAPTMQIIKKVAAAMKEDINVLVSMLDDDYAISMVDDFEKENAVPVEDSTETAKRSERIYQALVSAGVIKEGGDLTDEQLYMIKAALILLENAFPE